VKFGLLEELMSQLLVLGLQPSGLPFEEGDLFDELLLGLVGTADIVVHVLFQLPVLLVVVPRHLKALKLPLHALDQVQIPAFCLAQFPKLLSFISECAFKQRYFLLELN
jgi:hypothetical protein